MKAVILFSGGLDSTVVLAMALHAGLDCHLLSFDYGQRHRIELQSAKNIAKKYGLPHQIITIAPESFGHSALLSTNENVPKQRSNEQMALEGLPNTYVPARNTLFLAYALGQAELLHAQEIHVGFNATDGLPYPDCSLSYVQAFQEVMSILASAGGKTLKLVAPIITWNKSEIIRQGIALQAPLDLSFSCYDPSPKGDPCHQCDACVLRKEGFILAGL